MRCLAQARVSTTKVQLPGSLCWASCAQNPSQVYGNKSNAGCSTCSVQATMLWCTAESALDLSTSATTLFTYFTAMQVANPGTATEAKVDSKVAKEIWQALVWLSQWCSNVWPVLFPSLHACPGQLTCHSGCMLHCVACTASLQHNQPYNACSGGLSICLCCGCFVAQFVLISHYEAALTGPYLAHHVSSLHRYSTAMYRNLCCLNVCLDQCPAPMHQCRSPNFLFFD